MRRTVLVVLITTMTAFVGGVVGAAPAGARHTGSGRLPDTIALPDGFQPEGIARGRGTSFYVGSLADGAIFRGDLRTGEGRVFVPGTSGDVAVGVEVDRRNRLWVAGGATGEGRVYDAGTGRLLESYTFATANTFISDVVVTRRAAYFTDSRDDVLHVVPIGWGGRLGAARQLALTGDLVVDPAAFNLNGIEASSSGRTLLAVQSNTGRLFSVSARTGVTRQIDLRGVSLTNGDGLLRDGRTLYVVRNAVNQIAVLRLRDGFRSGRLVDTLTDPDLDGPTTVARRGDSLFAVNARFASVPTPTPQTQYSVVRVDID